MKKPRILFRTFRWILNSLKFQQKKNLNHIVHTPIDSSDWEDLFSKRELSIWIVVGTRIIIFFSDKSRTNLIFIFFEMKQMFLFDLGSKEFYFEKKYMNYSLMRN